MPKKAKKEANFTTRLKVTHAQDIDPKEWRHEITPTEPYMTLQVSCQFAQFKHLVNPG